MMLTGDIIASVSQEDVERLTARIDGQVVHWCSDEISQPVKVVSACGRQVATLLPRHSANAPAGAGSVTFPAAVRTSPVRGAGPGLLPS
jgi:hypothetical protein